MSACTMPALRILKAVPQHAEELGSSALAMMLALCAQWDSMGCSRAVCWSNSRLAERCGLSRNSISKVRQKLVDAGWLIYLQDGRKAGHYTPKLPEWFAQSSAVECANGVQLDVQTVCEQCADDCAVTVQMRVTYKPIPKPIPKPKPTPEPTVISPTDPSEELFSEGRPDPKPISREDHWIMAVQFEGWAKTIGDAGGKIGPRSWPLWKRIVSDYSIEVVTDAIKATDPDARWADNVEKWIMKNRQDAHAKSDGSEVIIL